MLSRFMKNLPVAYQVDPWIIDLFHAIQLEYQALGDDLTDVYLQLFLDSITWRVAGEETEAGLPIRPALSFADRRSALSAKWQSGAKCDIELIRRICSAWANTNPQVTYDGKKVVAVFCTVTGDITAIVRTLRVTIPAHLFMTFTAARAEETTGVYMDAVQIGNSSRSALPLVEPEQSLTDNLFLGTNAKEIASHSSLPTIEPEQSLTDNLFLGTNAKETASHSSLPTIEPEQSLAENLFLGANANEIASRSALSPLEANQSLSAELLMNAGTNNTASRLTLPKTKTEQNLDAPITTTIKPSGVSSRAVLLHLN